MPSHRPSHEDPAVEARMQARRVRRAAEFTQVTAPTAVSLPPFIVVDLEEEECLIIEISPNVRAAEHQQSDKGAAGSGSGSQLPHKLEGDQHKRTISDEDSEGDRLLKKAKFGTDSRTILEKKEISQEEADQIFLSPLASILPDVTRVCCNLFQRLKKKYQNGFFAHKPSTAS